MTIIPERLESFQKSAAFSPAPCPEEDAPQAATMKEDAQAKMENLKSQKGADFDKAYIASQVEMHQTVLNDLQNTLIPAAKDPQLKTFLETTKTHVQQHLEKAQKLQASMK